MPVVEDSGEREVVGAQLGSSCLPRIKTGSSPGVSEGKVAGGALDQVAVDIDAEHRCTLKARC